jgi:hypothetical protein
MLELRNHVLLRPAGESGPLLICTTVNFYTVYICDLGMRCFPVCLCIRVLTMTATSSLKAAYDSDGYVIVPNLISATEFAGLREAGLRATSLTRSGQWPHRRTVGKQFAPFNADNPDSWGIQHVMHPDLNAPEFVRWYTSDAVVGIAMELMECEEKDLQMGMCRRKETLYAFPMAVT